MGAQRSDLASKPAAVFARDATGLTKQFSARDALMLNMGNMGIGYAFLYMYYGPALYSGVNMLASVLIALPLSMIVAGVYLMLSIAMPRTGGDYVYNSRILHPVFGFVSTFWYVIILVTFVGISAVWVPQLALAPLLWSLGTASGNSGLISLSHTIGSTGVSAAIAVIIVICFILVMVTGANVSKRFAWVFFSLLILGFLVFIGTLLAAGSGIIASRFTTIAGTTPSAIIAAAKSAGGVTTFTLSGTVLGVVYSVLNYAGFVQSVYFAGEVKGEVRRSQLLAIFGSLLIFALILVIFYGVQYYAIGGSFINSLAFLASTGNPAYTLSQPPIGQTVILFATSNPILIGLGGLTFLFSILAGNVAYILISSRMIFAWSFDRLAPTRFINLDHRFNSPYLIYITIGVVGLISVFIDLYTGIFSYLAYSVTGYAIIYFLAGLAALLFPYRRKDIFETAPSLVKKRVLGMPLISLLGALAIVSSALIGYATLTPAFVGAPINPSYLAAVPAITLIGILIYFGLYAYNKSRGINLSLIMKEIPPE